ncbi:MAG: hypothetical protein Q4A88_06505 [Clostridia bacterium]|nr:hypothetical protein [Clostridia bacterium]
MEGNQIDTPRTDPLADYYTADGVLKDGFVEIFFTEDCRPDAILPLAELPKPIRKILSESDLQNPAE